MTTSCFEFEKFVEILLAKRETINAKVIEHIRC